MTTWRSSSRAAAGLILLAATIAGAAEPAADGDWPGRWGYTECVANPHETGHDCTAYQLTVRAADGRHDVELDVDASGTTHHIRATGHVDGDAFVVVFDAGPWTGASHSFKRGDVLLRLRTAGARVVTEWVSLRPVIDDPGPPVVCFQKLPDE